MTSCCDSGFLVVSKDEWDNFNGLLIIIITWCFSTLEPFSGPHFKIGAIGILASHELLY